MSSISESLLSTVRHERDMLSAVRRERDIQRVQTSELFRNRSYADMWMTFAQCLHRFYVWDVSTPPLKIGEVMQLVQRDFGRNFGWLQGIKIKPLMKPVTTSIGEILPCQILIQLVVAINAIPNVYRYPDRNVVHPWPLHLTSLDISLLQPKQFHIRLHTRFQGDVGTQSYNIRQQWKPILIHPSAFEKNGGVYIGLLLANGAETPVNLTHHPVLTSQQQHPIDQHVTLAFTALARKLRALHQHNYGARAAVAVQSIENPPIRVIYRQHQPDESSPFYDTKEENHIISSTSASMSTMTSSSTSISTATSTSASSNSSGTHTTTPSSSSTPIDTSISTSRVAIASTHSRSNSVTSTPTKRRVSPSPGRSNEHETEQLKASRALMQKKPKLTSIVTDVNTQHINLTPITPVSSGSIAMSLSTTSSSLSASASASILIDVMSGDHDHDNVMNYLTTPVAPLVDSNRVDLDVLATPVSVKPKPSALSYAAGSKRRRVASFPNIHSEIGTSIATSSAHSIIIGGTIPSMSSTSTTTTTTSAIFTPVVAPISISVDDVEELLDYGDRDISEYMDDMTCTKQTSKHTSTSTSTRHSSKRQSKPLQHDSPDHDASMIVRAHEQHSISTEATNTSLPSVFDFVEPDVVLNQDNRMKDVILLHTNSYVLCPSGSVCNSRGESHFNLIIGMVKQHPRYVKKIEMVKEVPCRAPPPSSRVRTKLKLKLTATHRTFASVFELWNNQLLFEHDHWNAFCLYHIKLRQEQTWFRAFMLEWFTPITQHMQAQQPQQPQHSQQQQTNTNITKLSMNDANAIAVPQFLEYHREPPLPQTADRLCAMCVMCDLLARAVISCIRNAANVDKLFGESTLCARWWSDQSVDERHAISNVLQKFFISPNRPSTITSIPAAASNVLGTKTDGVIEASELIHHANQLTHRVAISFVMLHGSNVYHQLRCASPFTERQVVPMYHVKPNVNVHPNVKFTPLLVTSPYRNIRLPYSIPYAHIRSPNNNKSVNQDRDNQLSHHYIYIPSPTAAHGHDKENINPNTMNEDEIVGMESSDITSSSTSDDVHDHEEELDDINQIVSSSSDVMTDENIKMKDPSCNVNSTDVGIPENKCLGIYHAEFKDVIHWHDTSGANVVERDPYKQWKTVATWRACPYTTSERPAGHACENDWGEWKVKHPERYEALKTYCHLNPTARVDTLSPVFYHNNDLFQRTIRSTSCTLRNDSKRTMPGYEYTCRACRRLVAHIRIKHQSILGESIQRSKSAAQIEEEAWRDAPIRSISAPLYQLWGASTKTQQRRLSAAIKVTSIHTPTKHPKRYHKQAANDAIVLRRSANVLQRALSIQHTKVLAVSDPMSDITEQQRTEWLNEMFRSTLQMGDSMNDMADTLTKLRLCLVRHSPPTSSSSASSLSPYKAGMLMMPSFDDEISKTGIQVKVVREIIDRLENGRGKQYPQTIWALATVLRLQLGYSMYQHIRCLIPLPSPQTLAQEASPNQQQAERIRNYDITRVGVNPWRILQAQLEIRHQNNHAINEPWVLATDAGRCTRRIDALYVDVDAYYRENEDIKLRKKELVLVGMKTPSYVTLGDLLKHTKLYIDPSSSNPDDISNITDDLSQLSEADRVIRYIQHLRRSRGYANQYQLTCISPAISFQRGATIASLEPQCNTANSQDFILHLIKMLRHCYLDPEYLNFDDVTFKRPPYEQWDGLPYRPHFDVVRIMGTSHDNAAYQQSGMLLMQSPHSHIVRGLVNNGAKFCARLWPGIKLMSPYLVPHNPLIMNTDYEHVQRLIIKSLRKYSAHQFTFGYGGNGNDVTVVQPQANKTARHTKDQDVSQSHSPRNHYDETYITASMSHFQQLHSMIRSSNVHDEDAQTVTYTLEDCHIQSVYDQRPDAAQRFLSIPLTDVLFKKVGPISGGTCILIRMTTYLTEPYHHPKYIGDPLAIQKSVSKGITMLRLWHHWLVNIARLGPIHSAKKQQAARFLNRPQYQACELLFHSATHWCLAIHRHFRHVPSISRFNLKRLSSRHCEQLICTMQGKSYSTPSNNPRGCFRDLLLHMNRFQKLHTALATLTINGAPTFTSKRAKAVDAAITTHQMRGATLSKAEMIATLSEAEFDSVMRQAHEMGQREAYEELCRFLPNMAKQLQQANITNLPSLDQYASSCETTSTSNKDRVFPSNISSTQCFTAVITCEEADSDTALNFQRVMELFPKGYCMFPVICKMPKDAWHMKGVQNVNGRKNKKQPKSKAQPQPHDDKSQSQEETQIATHLHSARVSHHDDLTATAIVPATAVENDASLTEQDTETEVDMDVDNESELENPTALPGDADDDNIDSQVNVLFPVPLQMDLEEDSKNTNVQFVDSTIDWKKNTYAYRTPDHIEDELFHMQVDQDNKEMHHQQVVVEQHAQSTSNNNAISSSQKPVSSNRFYYPSPPSQSIPPFHVLMEHDNLSVSPSQPKPPSVHIRTLLQQYQNQEWVSRDREASFITSNDLPGDRPRPTGNILKVNMDVMIWLNKKAKYYRFGRVTEIRDESAKHSHYTNVTSISMNDPNVTWKFKVRFYNVISSMINDPERSCRLEMINAHAALVSDYFNPAQLIAPVTLTSLPTYQPHTSTSDTENDQQQQHVHEIAMSQDAHVLKIWHDNSIPPWTDINAAARVVCNYQHVRTNLMVNTFIYTNNNNNKDKHNDAPQFATPAPRPSMKNDKSAIDTTSHGSSVPAFALPSMTTSSPLSLSSHPHHPVDDVVSIISSGRDKINHGELLEVLHSSGITTTVSKDEFINNTGTKGEKMYKTYKSQRRRNKYNKAVSSASDDTETGTGTDSDTNNHTENQTQKNTSSSSSSVRPPRHTRSSTRASANTFSSEAAVHPHPVPIVPSTTPSSAKSLAAAGTFIKERALGISAEERMQLIQNASQYTIPSQVCDITSYRQLCLYASIQHQQLVISTLAVSTNDTIQYECNRLKTIMMNYLKTWRSEDDAPYIMTYNNVISQYQRMMNSIPLSGDIHRAMLDELRSSFSHPSAHLRVEPHYPLGVAREWWKISRMTRKRALYEYCDREYNKDYKPGDTYGIQLLASALHIPICILQNVKATATTTTATDPHQIKCASWFWPYIPTPSHQATKQQTTCTSSSPSPSTSTLTFTSIIRKSKDQDLRTMIARQKRRSSSDEDSSDSTHPYRGYTASPKGCPVGMFSHVLVLGYLPSGHYVSMMHPHIPLHDNRRQIEWHTKYRDLQCDYQRRVYLCQPLKAVMASPLMQMIQRIDGYPICDLSDQSHRMLFEEILISKMNLKIEQLQKFGVMTRRGKTGSQQTSTSTSTSHLSTTLASNWSGPTYQCDVDYWMNFFTANNIPSDIDIMEEVTMRLSEIWIQDLINERNEKDQLCQARQNKAKTNYKLTSTISNPHQQDIASDLVYQEMHHNVPVTHAVAECVSIISTKRIMDELDPLEKSLINKMEKCLQHWKHLTNMQTSKVLHTKREATLATWEPLLVNDAWIKDEVIDWRMSALQNRYWLHDILPPNPHGIEKLHMMICSVFFTKQLFHENTYRFGRSLSRWCHGPYMRPHNIHDGFSLVLLPYNSGNNHWVLFVIDFHRRHIDLYDSLATTPTYNCIKSSNRHDNHERYRYCSDENFMYMHVIALWMNDEWKLQQASIGKPHTTYQDGYDFNDWYFQVHVDIPQQKEIPLTNCGLHVLINAQTIIEHNKHVTSTSVSSSSSNSHQFPHIPTESWRNTRRRIAIELVTGCTYSIR